MTLSDHMGLVIADELRRISSGREDEQEEKLVVFNLEDKTIDSVFSLIDQDENGDVVQMPIEGSGLLDSFVVISPDPNFEVTVEIDEFDVIDNTFSNIQTISDELSHIGAYTKNSDNVVSVSTYPFTERLNIVVRPLPGAGDITFSLIRAEINLGGEVDDDIRTDPEVSNILREIA